MYVLVYCCSYFRLRSRLIMYVRTACRPVPCMCHPILISTRCCAKDQLEGTKRDTDRQAYIYSIYCTYHTICILNNYWTVCPFKKAYVALTYPILWYVIYCCACLTGLALDTVSYFAFNPLRKQGDTHWGTTLIHTEHFSISSIKIKK